MPFMIPGKVEDITIEFLTSVLKVSQANADAHLSVLVTPFHHSLPPSNYLRIALF